MFSPIARHAPLPSGARRAPSRMRQRRAAAATALLAALALSACDSSTTLLPNCPRTGILSDAADLTRFRPAGTDLTDMVVDGRITGLSGKCSLEDPTHLHTVISVSMDLTRGPAAKGRDAEVTYFVSVAHGDQILDKRDYTLAVSFDGNSNQLRLAGDQIDFSLPVNDKVKGSDYRILVGYQLTPEELAFNRKRGAR